MKLPASKIASFLTKPDPYVRVILVYGPDAGLVRERVTHLAKLTVSDLADPFRVATLSASAVSEDPSRIYDEMAAQSLGGGKRLVLLQNPSDSAAGPIGKMMETMPLSDSLLLIECGDLDRRSKLRALCEGPSPVACAIPCYVEDAAARSRTIADILKNEGITAPRDVVAMLADSLPPDRAAMRSELEKLALYVGKGNTASVGDVQSIVQDAGAAEVDDLVFAVGSGDANLAVKLIERLFAEQISPVMILRAAQRHFLRIQWARAQMDNGLSAADAVKRLQPPVFWKYEASMTAQLRRWPKAKVEQALRRLYDAEAMVKRTGTPDQSLCSQVLLALAA